MKGFILTGLGAYLVCRKGLRVLSSSIKTVSETAKWRAYYRAMAKTDGKVDLLPPGYARTTKYTDGTVIFDDPKGKTLEEHDKTEASQEALRGTFKDAIDQTISALKERVEREKGASEARETASEGVTTSGYIHVMEDFAEGSSRSPSISQSLQDCLAQETPSDTTENDISPITIVKDEEE